MKNLFSKIVVTAFVVTLVAVGGISSSQSDSSSIKESKQSEVYPYVNFSAGGGSGLGNF